jgi:hypothetical protein
MKLINQSQPRNRKDHPIRQPVEPAAKLFSKHSPQGHMVTAFVRSPEGIHLKMKG